MNFIKKYKLRIFFILLFLGAFLGRSYYWLTDGFTNSNILSSYPSDARWEPTRVHEGDFEIANAILDQEFSYFSKGCQSYVFISQDKNYVLKFFKNQRYQTKPWVKLFSFIPKVNQYRLSRSAHKDRKRESLFESIRIAYDNLQKETGLVFIHLNKKMEFAKKVSLIDKIGQKMEIPIDEYEFFIQKKALMLTDVIEEQIKGFKWEESKLLLKNLLTLLLKEHEKGISDEDPALMQNTGVYQGEPIHVDVGQFVLNEKYKKEKVSKQALFEKFYKFRHWLKNNNNELANYFDGLLKDEFGSSFFDQVSKYE